MGSLYRSQEMTLCQIFFQTEATFACVSELGELGCVQFNDLNADVNAFQRKFVNEVRRCDEMERALRFIERELKTENISITEAETIIEAPLPKEMIELEANFSKLERELRDVNLNSLALKKTFLELTELKHILRKAQIVFEEDESDESDSSRKLVSNEVGQTAPLNFLAGVIPKSKVLPFERMLWRVCRGNTFLRLLDIEVPLEDPVTGDQVQKAVFILFFQGDQLKLKVKKICEGFRAVNYPCPEVQSDRRDMASGVMSRIEDLNIVLKQTHEHKQRVLVAASRNLRTWLVKVHKMKAIYHIMNYFNMDVTQKCLIAECWCSVDDLAIIQTALQRGNKLSGSSVPSIINRTTTRETPPTYNRTNKFTSGFQAIVDAYGVCNYREVNPAPFTIITFPFLFAVMFGDFGHGVLMFLFALWMVIKEKSLQADKSNNEIWNTFFNGRYIILLMGAFSMYTGLIYNDVFAKSFNSFGSSWKVPATFNESEPRPNSLVLLFPENDYWGTPYPFGVDPIWQMAHNKILYLNSLKMKTSIVLGVCQMVFGISLSLCNHLYFRNYISIFFEFIPQLLFMLCIFGYLVCLIFHKWVFFNFTNSGCAPTLLIHLINMFMFTYKGDAPCQLKTFYNGQQTLQSVLVIIAVLCVPWMLFIKPIILYFRAKTQKHRRLINSVSVDSSVDSVGVVIESESHSGGHGSGEFDMGDIMIHQTIHTIEYCLGSISHTASYLRLWALSLAHAQLSEVLWTMVMERSFMIPQLYGSVLVYVIFTFWSCLTIAILLIMEGLSAFLHALRLHWVEFQSKFYGGSGHAFEPFSFKTILDLILAEEQA